MYISWNWLSTLVDTDGLDPVTIAHELTMMGLEVEGIESYGQNADFDTVVVAAVRSITPHPDADKLLVCEIDAGPKGQRQVVCGAKNIAVGDHVPLAMLGTQMGEDFVLAATKLRGVESEGMLCSSRELGLSEDHSGILILPEGSELGAPVLETLDVADTVLELSLTPNRPDALSHVGVCRDLAALTGRETAWPSAIAGWRTESQGGDANPDDLDLGVDSGPDTEPIDALLTVEVRDVDGCPRYSAAVMTGMAVDDSPSWMTNRLVAIGQRPISNLVDVTNYVLHECGQPLHAFDLDKIEGGQLIVRRAEAGETIVTIDEVERTLHARDLVIADAKGPVAIAGVMGGSRTAVSETTTRIAIECAYFDMSRVRKTSRRLGLHTESSHRFERGTDPAGVPWFIRRAIQLFGATQRGRDSAVKLARGIIDVYPRPIEPLIVTASPEKVREVIGIDTPAGEMVSLLNRLDLPTTLNEAGDLRVQIPTFRPDIERPIDVVEEVARMVGYDSIDAVMPPGTMGFAHRVRSDSRDEQPETLVDRRRELATREIRTLLLSRGIREAVNYNFVDRREIERLGFTASDVRGEPIVVKNPIAEDMGVMRTSLIPGLLKNIGLARSRRIEDVNLFELGRIYLRENAPGRPLPSHVGGRRWGTHVEPYSLAVVLAGRAHQHFTGSHRYDVFDLRGLAEDLVVLATGRLPRFETIDKPAGLLHPYACAKVLVNGAEVGWIGSLHPDLLEKYGIEGTVLACELDSSRLTAQGRPLTTMTPIPRYPASRRDFALLVPVDLPYGTFETALESFADPRLVGHTLFDVFEGEQVTAGKKSLAVNVTFRDPVQTLDEDALTELHRRLIEHLAAQVGAGLR